MSHDREVFGVEIVPDGQTWSSFSFYESDILYIDTWKPKKNYQVPRIYTKDRAFTVSLTLDACAAAFPNFEKNQNGNLLNLKMVDRFELASYGADVYFKDSDLKLTMSSYKWESRDWNTLLSEQYRTPLDNRVIMGAQILDNGKLGTPVFIEVNEVLFIDSWKPKSNYQVPRFYTKCAAYTEVLTLQACTYLFPHFVSLDNGNIVNVELVDNAIRKPYEIVVTFKNSKFTTIMAESKRKYFDFLIQEKT